MAKTDFTDCDVNIVHTGDKLEIHQHIFTSLDRRKLHSELMTLRTSHPDFFKALQDICTEMKGDFMFVEMDDTEFKKFYGIKNILWDFYQEKVQCEIALNEEKTAVENLKVEIEAIKNKSLVRKLKSLLGVNV